MTTIAWNTFVVAALAIFAAPLAIRREGQQRRLVIGVLSVTMLSMAATPSAARFHLALLAVVTVGYIARRIARRR